jgi:hypothetical protein
MIRTARKRRDRTPRLQSEHRAIRNQAGPEIKVTRYVRTLNATGCARDSNGVAIRRCASTQSVIAMIRITLRLEITNRVSYQPSRALNLAQPLIFSLFLGKPQDVKDPVTISFQRCRRGDGGLNPAGFE